MERLKVFATTPTIAVVNMLSKAEQENRQEIVNICAYELACRIYISNEDVTFSQILRDFGYKSLDLEEQNNHIMIK